MAYCIIFCWVAPAPDVAVVADVCFWIAYVEMTDKIGMQASQEKTAITIDLTRRALKDFIHTDKKKYVTIDEIQTSICKFYRIKIDDLLGKKKTKNIAYPRQIAMYLCRELTPNTFPHIGKAFGGRDHTTVMQRGFI